ncbi:hypothetical protein NIES204_44050 (plasmid) [Planktothrix agardhii NIES-204]|jgi:hypothetical protein|nr:hypothetical protein NIES204_44050 [Planktothrix agardhii NIES-204]CAD5985890.1 hypothetical protein PCC7821_05021 [Planktothrix rubescens NIVA-CYA 18]
MDNEGRGVRSLEITILAYSIITELEPLRMALFFDVLIVIPFLKSDATVDRASNLFYIDLN